MYVLENCEEVWPFMKEHQDELEKQTPRVDDMNGGEFQNWFRAHVFKLSTQESVSEELISLAVVLLQQVYLFKCHWWDVAHFERGYKVDKYGFVSVNTKRSLNTNEPFVLASQAKQGFYLDDISYPGWLVVVKTNPRDLFDVPQEDKEDDGDGVTFDQAYQPIEVDQLNLSNDNEVENEITVTLHREMTGLGRGRGGRGGKVNARSTGQGRYNNQEVSSTPRSLPLQEVPRVEEQHQISPVAQRGFQSFPDIIEEEIEGSPMGEGSINPSAGSCTSKPVRGKYKSLSLDIKTRNGEKVKINIPEGLQRAVGVDARDIASYCGFVLRQIVTFKVGRWQNVFATYGQAMCLKVKEKFEILDDRRELAMDTFVIDTLQRLFRAWKNRLHTHYKKFPTNRERLDNRPIDVTPEDWNWLVEHYSSDTFKVVSERNKRNKAKQIIRHTSGPRSFAEVEELTRDPATGENATADAVWEIQHTRKTNGGRVWLDPKSQEIHGRLQELVSQQKDNQHPLTGDEILESVLGEKSGYVRGKGYGKKPISKRARQQIDVEASVSSAIDAERAEYERKLQVERNELQLKEQEKHAEHERKMQYEIDQRIQAQMAILMSNFQQVNVS
ncbi:uncharacterized protein G2W53_001035 [Senna tora]|uniref:DUF4216 domain-containing protein n=1 Tax=Senna tora TaxID=362788 RepID=A0A834XGQ9_9FABA|nr:uncharacterized protein G2W53_001035 [Senna tora]